MSRMTDPHATRARAASRRGKTLLKGHTLVAEGMSFNADGSMKGYGWDRVGHAKCRCGVLSPELPSVTARKQWHREHKDSLR